MTHPIASDREDRLYSQQASAGLPDKHQGSEEHHHAQPEQARVATLAPAAEPIPTMTPDAALAVALVACAAVSSAAAVTHHMLIKRNPSESDPSVYPITEMDLAD